MIIWLLDWLIDFFGWLVDYVGWTDMIMLCRLNIMFGWTNIMTNWTPFKETVTFKRKVAGENSFKLVHIVIILFRLSIRFKMFKKDWKPLPLH